jgi:nucleotidyltransferase substrate binding protein (TIGR01987 family)
LQEIIEANEDITVLEAIVKEGIVQRFEYTFELAWKTLKDKMIEDGLLIDKISPKYIFKLAFQSKYIEDVDLWIAMTNDRNLMSHTYDFSTFDSVLVKLQSEYYPLIKKLNNYFIEVQQ